MFLINIVFVFFDQQAIAFWTPGINLLNIEKWL